MGSTLPGRGAQRSDLVLVGVIEGAFGVRGEARVRSFTAEPENIFGYGPLLDERGAVALTPGKWRPLQDAFAVTAPEIASREDATAKRNTRLYVPRAKLPPPDEDEIYVVDLIGCRVEDAGGAPLGEVIAVHDFGAGDLLEIRPADGAPFFLAFTKANVPTVDLANRRLVADPPPEEDP